MAKVNVEKIPPELRAYIPYAEKWGQQDIDVRERLVENATIEELHDLTSIWEICIGPISRWLQEPQARAKSTIDEYVAFTCLILAVSSARKRLDRLSK